MENPCYSGGCLCGHIRFQAHGVPGNPHSCSCDFCRRHSGAPTLCWVEFPRQAVEWNGPGGIPALFRSSPYSSRAFCPRCGSTLGAIDDEPTVALTTGSFDRADLPELRPTSHAFADVCPEWWRIDGMR
ncbi:GFA family protein [Serratia marcescens]|uniref:GFA family protein n=1 Tax=Serratia marcescens TaxID=615 RepID=UPI0018D7BC6A|nr:GFA family protein [Serratia marcescens]MBH2776321.1 GFA family protein [Serratia marcescens]MBH3280032.1 GFA family protein [Serratia marcescens]MBN5427888.1 GFA family protein [Serratia marcescens]MDI3226520.1 GFA family protein [Serratia marcescens]BEN20575.1 aldehyde-activating protein [Serratia marcescens]